MVKFSVFFQSASLKSLIMANSKITVFPEPVGDEITTELLLFRMVWKASDWILLKSGKGNTCWNLASKEKYIFQHSWINTLQTIITQSWNWYSFYRCSLHFWSTWKIFAPSAFDKYDQNRKILWLIEDIYKPLRFVELNMVLLSTIKPRISVP